MVAVVPTVFGRVHRIDPNPTVGVVALVERSFAAMYTLVALSAPADAARAIWIWLVGATVTKLPYASAYAADT